MFYDSLNLDKNNNILEQIENVRVFGDDIYHENRRFYIYIPLLSIVSG